MQEKFQKTLEILAEHGIMQLFKNEITTATVCGVKTKP